MRRTSRHVQDVILHRLNRLTEEPFVANYARDSSDPERLDKSEIKPKHSDLPRILRVHAYVGEV